MGSPSSAGKGRKAGAGKTLTVDFQRLFSELNRRSGEAGALRAEEVAKILSQQLGREVSLTYARGKIRELIDAGKAKATKKIHTSMDGRVGPVPAYVFEG